MQSQCYSYILCHLVNKKINRLNTVTWIHELIMSDSHTWHIYIHWYNAITASHHRIWVMVVASAICTTEVKDSNPQDMGNIWAICSTYSIWSRNSRLNSISILPPHRNDISWLWHLIIDLQKSQIQSISLSIFHHHHHHHHYLNQTQSHSAYAVLMDYVYLWILI